MLTGYLEGVAFYTKPLDYFNVYHFSYVSFLNIIVF